MATAKAKGMFFLRTFPSEPRMPAVVVPSTILPGAMAVPMPPPAVWAPRMAVNMTNIMLEALQRALRNSMPTTVKFALKKPGKL